MILLLGKSSMTSSSKARSLDDDDEIFVEPDVAPPRLHPDLKRAYDNWQASGHAGSLYDYLPGSYLSSRK